MKTTTVTASDVISGRARPKPTGRKVLALPLGGMLDRWQTRGVAVAAATMILRHAFVEGLRDSQGSDVDPRTTGVEVRCDDASPLAIIRLLPLDRTPVEIRCAPSGRVTVVGSDGRATSVTRWRDLPDILPAFITA